MNARDGIRRAIRALPLPPALRARLATVAARYRLGQALERNGLVEPLSRDIEQWAPFVRFAPPGHFYSPLPRLDEIEPDAGRIFDFDVEVPGIDLRVPQQLDLVSRIAAAIGDDPFASEPTPGRRYHTANHAYGVGDASVLHGVLRLYRPARIVEIGSGYSSAVILDVVERHLPGTAVTFVEPYSELLRSLMHPGDHAHSRIIEQRVQDLPIDVIQQLDAGDVLLIDSTHVVRTGSDVCHLVLDVLPALAPGVVVHLHDIFWPFELPRAWVEEGRQWSECYLVRAFLTGNRDWEILLFNDYVGRYHVPFLQGVLPQFLDNPGGSLWIRRVR